MIKTNTFTSTVFHSLLLELIGQYNTDFTCNPNTPSTYYLTHSGGKYKEHALTIDLFFDTISVTSKYKLSDAEIKEITNDANEVIFKTKQSLYNQYLAAAKIFDHSTLKGIKND